MLQSGFNMRSAKVGAYCPSPAPTLVVLVVLLVGSVQFVQCHNVDDYSEFDDPELLPLFTQLGYGQISNMTTMLSAEFQKCSNFCVKDLFVSLLLKLLQPWQSGLSVNDLHALISPAPQGTPLPLILLGKRIGWKLVYVDHENDVLLVGDDPWEEFVNWVHCIKILYPQEVQQMRLGGDIGNSLLQKEVCNSVLLVSHG